MSRIAFTTYRSPFIVGLIVKRPFHTISRRIFGRHDHCRIQHFGFDLWKDSIFFFFSKNLKDDLEKGISEFSYFDSIRYLIHSHFRWYYEIWDLRSNCQATWSNISQVWSLQPFPKCCGMTNMCFVCAVFVSKTDVTIYMHALEEKFHLFIHSLIWEKDAVTQTQHTMNCKNNNNNKTGNEVEENETTTTKKMYDRIFFLFRCWPKCLWQIGWMKWGCRVLCRLALNTPYSMGLKRIKINSGLARE